MAIIVLTTFIRLFKKEKIIRKNLPGLHTYDYFVISVIIYESQRLACSEKLCAVSEDANANLC